MRIVCDPNPFCFGSTSTMRAVLEHLPDAEAIVLGTGPTLDLCPDLNVRACDVRDPAQLSRHMDVLRKADLYVAFSNNTNVPRVLDLGLPLAFVDIHYAMKRQTTAAMGSAGVYIIENHPGVEESLRRFSPTNPVLVGPMVSAGGARVDRSRSRLLVNIGGASSPDIRPGINTDYPRRTVALVDRLAGRLGLGDVTVAMGSAARTTVPNHPLARARTLSAPDYLATLRSADVLLTAPGLNAPLEAFSVGVPVCFLPPQNLTQVAHLQTYVDAGLAPAGAALLEVVPGKQVDLSRPEHEGTAAVLDALRRLNDEAWRRIEELVLAQLTAGQPALRALGGRQKAWFEALGMNGAARAAQALRRVASCA